MFKGVSYHSDTNPPPTFTHWTGEAAEQRETSNVELTHSICLSATKTYAINAPFRSFHIHAIQVAVLFYGREVRRVSRLRLAMA